MMAAGGAAEALVSLLLRFFHVVVSPPFFQLSLPEALLALARPPCPRESSACSRAHIHDQEKFTKFFLALGKAARAGTPLDSLGGEALTPELLDDCMDELRPSCDFPVPPNSFREEPQQSPFHREIQQVLQGAPQTEHVPINQSYIRLDPDTFTILKIGQAPVQIPLREHGAKIMFLMIPNPPALQSSILELTLRGRKR